jgi:GTPase SAR1 family protein
MLCCGEGEEAKSNKAINKLLRQDKKRLESEVKLLLLGAGESGKSTIAKQMKIIHLQGFTEQERITYRSIIFNNIIGSIRVLINASSDMRLEVSPSNVDAASRLTAEGDGYFNGPLTKQHVSDIKDLWNDPAIQQAFSRSNEFQLSDSASYYFANIDRIGAEGYIPNEQDILRSRAKTTGIIEIEFDVEEVHFRMVDVGGQRSERKKWIHCFQDVTAVIFCVALSEYDLKLYEDDTTNRMHESLRLFREICNSEWFRDTAMILFLNKKDLFQEKITRVNLTVCFPDYKGDKKYDSAIPFIQNQFLNQNQNQKKPIYPHVTCATDTENITVVFNAVKDIVLRKALDNAGIV